MVTSPGSSSIGFIDELAGTSDTLPPLRVYVLTVASSPGMPATTMSPLSAVGLRAGDDEVAVEDAGVDHRLASDPEHEQIAVAGEVGGQRQDLLDVLLRQHVGAGGHVAHERDVAGGPALERRARVRVVAHLDGAGLGRVATEEAELLAAC